MNILVSDKPGTYTFAAPDGRRFSVTVEELRPRKCATCGETKALAFRGDHYKCEMCGETWRAE